MSRFNGEDFVPTISDSEEDVPDFEGEDDVEDSANETLKRKREDESAPRVGKQHKKKRRKEEHIPNPEPASGEDSDAFDPGFTFDLETSSHGYLQPVNGWAMPQDLQDASLASGTDIDAIVARRRAREKPSQNGEIQLAKGDIEEEEVDSDDRSNESIEGGDENGDADSSATSVEENEATPLSSSKPLQTNGHAQDGASSGDDEEEDDNEVSAEPVPHPDDDLPMGDGASDVEDDEDQEVTKRRDAFFASGDSDIRGQPLATTSGSFESMSLSRHVLRGLAASGFTSPTPIQAKAIPVALMGKDVVGGAVTGSGKTAAFLIPILERLLYRDRKLPATRVSILLPSRELAVQCHKVAQKLASSVPGLSIALMIGGLSRREQEQTLKQRPDIVIATPGRFIDHMRNTASFAVENVEILVLDEADRMLEAGFADELNEILTTIPKSRQTMLFSATMTDDVDQLIRVGLNRPVRLMVDAKRQTVAELVQEFIKMKGNREEVDEERRLAYLLHLCSNVYRSKTIVFFQRKTLAHHVKVLFALQGLKAAELHGNMSQEQRLNAIASFQAGTCTHLLATDLASRGLDIPRVESIINFTVPPQTDTYLHRVGRTARAGQSGVSCTLFSPTKEKSSNSKEKQGGTSERAALRPILKLARKQKATIRTRTLPLDTINKLTEHIHSLAGEIEAILHEEKEERVMQQTERDMKKGENLIDHEDEIKSRPRRTWFQNEKEKLASSKLGMEERTGEAPKPKKVKKKLSNNDKKKLLNRDDRNGSQGAGWKKGKDERAGKGVLEQNKKKKKGKGSDGDKPKSKVTKRPSKAKAGGKGPTRR